MLAFCIIWCPSNYIQQRKEKKSDFMKIKEPHFKIHAKTKNNNFKS